MTSPLSVVILAAGLGTRMKSKRAKVLHRAGGLTLIEHVVKAAQGITPAEHITVVVGHQAAEVQALLAPLGVHFAEQKEQKGTGDAVMKCRAALEPKGGLVVVVYGDCPLLARATLQELVERQKQSAAAATLITTRLEDPSGYGRVVFGDRGEVQSIVEQKAATPEQLSIQFINSGIYCFRADLLWKHIAEIRPDNPAHEYYLTDMVEILNRAGHKVEAMEVANSNELLGINTRVELAEVDQLLRERKARDLMLSGVTIEKPETVTIDGGRVDRPGLRGRALCADPRQHRDRSRLPYRRLLDHPRFHSGGGRRSGAFHLHCRLRNRSRCAHRSVRSPQGRQSGRGKTPISATLSS